MIRNFNTLVKARDVFELFRLDMYTDRDKAGAIQAFEFAYELAWKTMKHVLFFRGIVTNSPRETFRYAALEKLIDNPEVWFVFLDKRNITVHTYEIENRDNIIIIFDTFANEVNMLIQRLQEFN